MKQLSLSQAASLAILAAGTLALTAPAHAQLVTNGGFETSDFTGWTLSGAADYTSDNPNTFVFSNAHSGDYAAWLGPVGADGFLSQTIATTAGQAYTVSYWLAVDTPTAVTSAGVSADDPAIVNDFISSFGGQTLFTQTNLAPTDSHDNPADDYVHYSFTTVASSAASTLQFGFRNDPSEFRLDDVSVTTAAVPEPSTPVSLAVLLSLTGTVVVAHRRKAAKA